MVSAGHVHNPSAEAATGQVNEELLRKVCEMTSGTYLENADGKLELTGSNVSRYVELWPFLLLVFIALFVVDLLIRRWENLLGLFEQVGGIFGGGGKKAGA
tara:strand:- start:181 stop:483 length:303 start_codon:yes stop_codon:yes gene_type:complete